MNGTEPGGDVRGFYAALGVPLPAWAHTEAPVRCFADPDAHRHEDRNPSCSVNLHSGAFNCHGCGAHGGAYDAALATGRSPREAIDLMVKNGLGAVIVTAGSKPNGIFTERDVLKRVAVKDINTKKTAIKELMTSPLITMASTDLVRDVLVEMYRRDIRNMPVGGEKGELIGIVSMPDILQYAQAFDIDEKVRQAWKEVEEYYNSEDQYTPG